MLRAGSVTRFAGDIDLGPRGVERIRAPGVIFFEFGAVTFSTHVIPVLLASGPMQLIRMRNQFIVVNVKPALAAFVARPRIPGSRQDLQTAVRKLHEILLQWRYPVNIPDFEILQFTVRIVCADPVLAVTAKERAGHVEVLEFATVKIAEDRVLIRLLHCKVMVRALPVCELRCMTSGTQPGTNESGHLHPDARRRCCLFCGLFAGAQDHANRCGNDGIKKKVGGPVNDMNGRERYGKNPGAANRMRNTLDKHRKLF